MCKNSNKPKKSFSKNSIFESTIFTLIMEKIIISNHDEFASYLGKEMGVSPYHKITQDQINLFADSTLDHQWIHTDPEKAAVESPFKATIAHGYLTLSLLPYLWDQMAEVRNIKMLVNYGIENFKFGQAVVVDSEVRLVTSLVDIKNLRGISKVSMKMKLEIKGEKKAAYEGVVVFLYHFNS